MNLIDRVILEWSYRTKKGYPDIKNEDDIKIFEATFGFNPIVTELQKLDFDVLTDRGKEIANELIKLLGIEKEQIKPASKTAIVIYDEDRPTLFTKLQNSEQYGKATKARTGHFKKDGITIILKPTGAKAGEFFELKPQQLNITLDKKIPLKQLYSELQSGIKSNTKLSDIQKQALLYAVTGENPISDKDKAELPKGFFNEVNKNFGELHGALLFGQQHGCDSVEFPAAGNYRLLDYILYKGEERIQVSAKSGSSVGNTVKYIDVLKLVDLADGDISDTLRKFTNIIDKHSVYEGAFMAVNEFGSNELKKAIKDYKAKYPHFPKLGRAPEDEQSHRERIAIEKAFVKEINNDPEFSFNEAFNNYVEVKYVKYYLDTTALQGVTSVIDSGNFNVVHASKNSPNHDSDKLGLKVSKSK